MERMMFGVGPVELGLSIMVGAHDMIVGEQVIEAEAFRRDRNLPDRCGIAPQFCLKGR